MNFEKIFNDKINYCERILDKFIPSEKFYPEIIFESMRYSIFAGGKRIRPIILISTYELFLDDENKKSIEEFVAAIEMIHTYSLIHDDLPAIDNDDYRRGKLTNHKKFGENIAILTGDALLHHSFEIMVDACLRTNDINYIRAMKVISNACGVYGMLSGQVVDVCSENISNSNVELNKKLLNFIHNKKTACMIKACFEVGAIIGGANESALDTFSKIGEKVGIAFQIQDDILDILGSKEILGKDIGSDKKNNKLTYVSLYGIDKSIEEVEKLSNEAIDIINDKFGEKSKFLVELIKYLIKRNY